MYQINYIITDAACFKEYKSLLSSGEWKWVFMGTDPFLKDSIQKDLSYEYNYSFAEELQKICCEKKQLFLDSLAEYFHYQKTPFVHATNAAYKNPLTSDLFLDFCFFSLISKWVIEKKEKMIIFVENPLLVKTCLLALDDQNCEVRFRKRYLFMNKTKSLFSSYLRLIHKFLLSLILWIYNRVFCNHHYTRMDIKLRQAQMLLFTWVEDRSFQKDEFVDPYIGKLKEYYNEMGLTSLFLTLPLLPFNLLKKSYQSREVFPSINLLSFRDLFSVFTSTLSFKWKKIQGTHSFSIFEPLFASEKKWDRQDMFLALLHYKACVRLFSLQDLHFKHVIYPFENQPWDKMMILAIKRSEKKCTTIGYQHTTIPSLMLNYFLGKYETETQPQPDVIVSNGVHWRQVLEASGFSSQIRNGGSLRYVSVCGSNLRNESFTQYSEVKEKNILVLLSYSILYSIDLIFFLLCNNDKGKNFLIKPHPNFPESIIRKYFPQLPGNFTFIQSTMSECTSMVSFAIHTGTTAAVECMMAGIKVIKYLPERIDLDPLLELGFSQYVVTDKDDLDFNKAEMITSFDNSIIAEPFDATTWREVLSNDE
jgi:hypothetical protein